MERERKSVTKKGAKSKGNLNKIRQADKMRERKETAKNEK